MSEKPYTLKDFVLDSNSRDTRMANEIATDIIANPPPFKKTLWRRVFGLILRRIWAHE